MASGDDFSRISGEGDLKSRQDQLETIRGIVVKNIGKATEGIRQQYNMRHKQFAKPFAVGQIVYRRNMKLSNALEPYNAKIGPQYLPAKVLAKKGSSSYELVDPTGKNLGVWPANLLKPA